MFNSVFWAMWWTVCCKTKAIIEQQQQQNRWSFRRCEQASTHCSSAQCTLYQCTVHTVAAMSFIYCFYCAVRVRKMLCGDVEDSDIWVIYVTSLCAKVLVTFCSIAVSHYCSIVECIALCSRNCIEILFAAWECIVDNSSSCAVVSGGGSLPLVGS